jgi:hypothetical protein
MAMQGGSVQVEQSNMPLACSMGNMAKGGISQAAISEEQYLIWRPQANV